MLVVCLLSFLVISGKCTNIQVSEVSYNEKLIKCVIDLVKVHFGARKVLTYDGNRVEDEELLKSINTANIVSVVSRKSSKKIPVQHEAYLISAKNATYLAGRMPNFKKDSTWNPMARFMVIVKELKESEMRIVFDTLLKLRVHNVVVVNATKDAHLYTYDTYENHNCGKRYDSYKCHGKCPEAYSLKLYQKRNIKSIANCTFNVLITQWPPYTMFTTNNTDKSSPLRYGAEMYILQLIGRARGFNIKVINDDRDTFSEIPNVTNNVEATRLLKKVQDNEADIVLGGMLLTPSRAKQYSYVFGHLAYTDEIRFVVKRASTVPPWKDIYLEFGGTVWVLIILALIVYSMLVIILLKKKDKSYVVLILLDNLLVHGRDIESRWTVKCVLILWVWFAYLVNSFYQSNLFSLTTNPAQEYQISKEEDIAKYRLKPCFSSIMAEYYEESIESVKRYKKIDGCDGLMESVAKVADSDDLYTIMLYGQYLYNEQAFFDDYGNSRVVTLPKPYSKVIYSMFFYKGFPLGQHVIQKSLRLTENGLVQKVMSDMNYNKQVKHNFHEKEFQGRFAIPWRVYIFGCFLSVVTFVIEINMSKFNFYK